MGVLAPIAGPSNWMPISLLSGSMGSWVVQSLLQVPTGGPSTNQEVRNTERRFLAFQLRFMR